MKRMTIEECVKQVIELNPTTAKEVLKASAQVMGKVKWHKVFFKVCTELNIDCEDFSK